jgi:hypothetical protein
VGDEAKTIVTLIIRHIVFFPEELEPAASRREEHQIKNLHACNRAAESKEVI